MRYIDLENRLASAEITVPTNGDCSEFIASIELVISSAKYIAAPSPVAHWTVTKEEGEAIDIIGIRNKKFCNNMTHGVFMGDLTLNLFDVPTFCADLRLNDPVSMCLIKKEDEEFGVEFQYIYRNPEWVSFLARNQKPTSDQISEFLICRST